MRDKFFTYAERIGVYARGKRAFDEGRQRSYNPYVASKDLAGLWWQGWDTAKGNANEKDRHLRNDPNQAQKAGSNDR